MAEWEALCFPGQKEYVMAEPVVKVFGQYETADEVRSQLLAAGFDRDQVQLNANNDEAGAVQGNFVVGNTDSERDHSGGPVDRTAGLDDHLYDRDFKEVVYRGNYLLIVIPGNEAQAREAKRILDQADPHQAGERVNV